jgi:large subunit ribosomal protein L4
MAKIAVINWKKEQVGEVSVPAGVLDYPYRRHLVWEVVKAYRAGQRAGTHKTKVRSEVSGSGKKQFKQKGTGRARQGGGRPPINRHGGFRMGPCSHAQDRQVGEEERAEGGPLPPVRRAHRRLDKMDLQSAKTRDLKAAVDTLGIRGKALFVDVDARENENFARASRNVRDGSWSVRSA